MDLDHFEYLCKEQLNIEILRITSLLINSTYLYNSTFVHSAMDVLMRHRYGKKSLPLLAVELQGDFDLALALVEKHRFEPPSELLSLAVSKNNEDAVTRLIKDGRCNLNANNGEPLIIACKDVNLKICHLLLADSRCNMYAGGGQAILTSWSLRNLELCKLFVAHKRDGFLFNKYAMSALNHSVERGDLEIVQFTLKCFDIRYSIDFKEPLLSARLKRDHVVVNLIESHSSFIPGLNDSISYAARLGHDGVLKYLLKNSQLDPNHGKSYSLIASFDHRHFEVTKMLLAYRKVHVDDYYILKKACASGLLDVVQCVIQYDQNILYQKAMVTAISGALSNWHFDIIVFVLY